MQIGKELVAASRVKRRYAQLEYAHISYVIDSLRSTNKRIRNIRTYLLTALYNAPITMGPFFSAAVRHDTGGD